MLILSLLGCPWSCGDTPQWVALLGGPLHETIVMVMSKMKYSLVTNNYKLIHIFRQIYIGKVVFLTFIERLSKKTYECNNNICILIRKFPCIFIKQQERCMGRIELLMNMPTELEWSM